MQGTESQPEPALAKEEPETSDFGHQQVKEQMTPSLRLPGPPGGSHGKECLPRRRHGDAGPIPGGADPLEKGKAAHSSLPAQESHGQGSLVGCSPWGHSELDTPWRLTLTHSLHPVGRLASGQPCFSLLQMGLGQGTGDAGSPGFTNPSSATPGQSCLLLPRICGSRRTPCLAVRIRACLAACSPLPTPGAEGAGYADSEARFHVW